MRWFYAVGSEKVGPVTEQDIEMLAQNGTITPNTYVWNDLIAKWVLYGELKAGKAERGGAPRQAAAPAAAQSVCAECGRTFPVDNMVRYGRQTVCASCKPAFFQKVKEGASLPNSFVYAGFWTRFGAKFIDSIVLYVINMAISFVLTGSMVASAQPGQNIAAVLGPMMAIMGLQVAFAAAYSVFFVGKFAATPGKMALGIKIITPDGGRVGYGRALGRHFAEILSSIILGIGYLMAAFDQEKRALHDRICTTRVVKK